MSYPKTSDDEKKHLTASAGEEGVLASIEDALWSRRDAMKLYRALFELVPDALVLADSSCRILGINGNAASMFGRTEEELLGTDCRELVSASCAREFDAALRSLGRDAVWNGTLEALGQGESAVPVEIAVHKVSIASDVLFQIVLHDISAHVTLEQDLQRSEAVLEGMNLALRHVIQSVHEERKEMKDELVQQVKEQVLPAIERIAEEDSSDIRQNYKAVIEDQLVEMADTPPDLFDNVLIHLTPRENEICRLIALGRKTREICELLQVSFETMQTHRKNIRKKLGLTGKGISLYVFLQQGQQTSPR
ncbi:PAS domain S-box protein [Desulfovibrio mangrovi]|uniref:helix-turn-helix transcriptional regulator n=1 Tax=Desulfovibrio mangrovi TaxID=2976983 RepID=UPI0022474403|nr:PAS domain-containing protein [Desulfovibrio mangrovi]UZP68220.1 PAS domain S-box protein [Desulfovibrio mangrovi]